MQVFPEQSQSSPVATWLLTLQAHEKKKAKNNTQHLVSYIKEYFWHCYYKHHHNRIQHLCKYSQNNHNLLQLQQNSLQYKLTKKKKEKNNTQNLVSYIKEYLWHCYYTHHHNRIQHLCKYSQNNHKLLQLQQNSLH